jgi:hypothetical protein
MHHEPGGKAGDLAEKFGKRRSKLTIALDFSLAACF